MARAEKVAVVEELADKLGRTRGVMLADYRGLSVGESAELRRMLREAGVEFKVVKNTLASLAAEKAGRSALRPLLQGPTAIAFVYEDPVAGARVLSRFAREHKQFSIKGGVLGNESLSPERIQELAALPGRDVLLARVGGGLAAPLVGMAAAMAAVLRQFVGVVEALRRQKEEAGAQGAP